MLSIERARILKNAAPLIEKVKSLCQRRGANGFQGLARMFRIFDDNNDLLIDLPELRTGLSDYGIELSPDEVSLLQSAFDRNGDGRINMNEFLMTIRGTLNSFRRKLVLAAFQKFDRNGNGIIETDDLIGVYSAKNHPLVQEGKMTEADVLREFLFSFDDVCYPDGVVHWIEFESYYAGVSANIDNDEYFDLMMRNAWNLTDDDIRAVTRNQVEVVTSHLQNNTENSNGKSLVGKSMNNESYCSGMVNEESNNSTQLYSTVRSIQHQNKPTIPRRIVGYTGHIPGSADRFAESFNIVQEHARVPPKRFAVTSMQAHPLPTMVKKISRANAHSYRLE